MKAQKHLKIAGILVLILGIIHCCATPVVLIQLGNMPIKLKLTFIFMFVCAGLATMLIGWLQYFLAKQAQLTIICFKILRILCWLILILGIGAVLTMWDNPFAYLILFIALYGIISFFRLKKPLPE